MGIKLIAGALALTILHQINAATFWIKEAHDTSTWPYGYPIPQPINQQDVLVVYGDVFNGTDTDFDNKMRNHLYPSTTCYIGPGCFLTRRIYTDGWAQTWNPGWRLQDHSEVHGAGMQGTNYGGTTLVAANYNWEIGSHGIVVIGSNVGFQGSNIVVTDLEIDCNAKDLVGDFPNPADEWNFVGVEVWGTHDVRVENVLVKNAVGYGTESFTIQVNAATDYSDKNLIKNCEVREFHNPDGNAGCSAISMNRWDYPTGSINGRIENCRVYLNGFRTDGKGYSLPSTRTTASR